jgi:hypothetical protein
MIADSGPMCFDDEKTRDCADMGSNMACRVNRDGFIGGGCVEDVNHMIPNLEGAGCSKGFCENFDGVCQPETSCFVDPCESKRCESGQVCESNYCGGCEAKCVDNGMAQNSAPLSDCPRGECHNPDGICEAEMSCAVDPCNGHECEFGEVCQTNMCGGCHAICAPDPLYVDIEPASGSKAGKSTTTTIATTIVTSTIAETTEAPELTEVLGANCPEAKWHISTLPGGANTCTNDKVYPEVWDTLEGYLFDSAAECCDQHGDDCKIFDNCEEGTTTTTSTVAETTEAPEPTEVPGADCPEAKWHISTLSGGAYTCTNDYVYPEVWDTMEGFMFDSAAECCVQHGDNCKIVDHCDCPKNWHMSVTPGEAETCTNDKDYPSSWNSQPHVFIFSSAEECCEESYGNPNCNKRDVCKKCIDTWHVNPEAPGSSCSNGNDAPLFWPDLMKGYPTGEACCLGYYGENNACEIVNKCEGEDTETVTTAATPDTGIPAVKSEKWWYSKNPSLPGGGECVYSDTYDDNWIIEFPQLLYDDKDGCCDNHQDVSCLLTAITAKPTLAPVTFTNEPTLSPSARPSRWYFDENANDCVEGTGYPDWMAAGLNAYSYLFSSKNDCCSATGKCTGSTKATKWWPKADGSGGYICTFSSTYPEEFLQHAASTLFDNEEDCCAIFCDGATTTEAPQATEETTTVVTTTESPKATTTEAPQTTTSPKETTTEVVTTESPQTTTEAKSDPLASSPFVDITEGFDSFDDFDNSRPMPWILGDPEEWVRDNTHTLQGNGSMRNVAPDGLGASSDLSLKIRLKEYSIIKCYAYIDVAMPYDSFELEVNGEIRYASYSPKGSEWIPVTTGLQDGENVVTFRVQNPDFVPPGQRSKGSGFVWLDVCELLPMG